MAGILVAEGGLGFVSDVAIKWWSLRTLQGVFHTEIPCSMQCRIIAC